MDTICSLLTSQDCNTNLLQNTSDSLCGFYRKGSILSCIIPTTSPFQLKSNSLPQLEASERLVRLLRANSGSKRLQKMRFHRNDCITQRFLFRPRNNHVVYNRRGTTSKREWKKSIKKKTPVLRITELSGLLFCCLPPPPPTQMFYGGKKRRRRPLSSPSDHCQHWSVTCLLLVKARGYRGAEQRMAACKDHCNLNQLLYETSYVASTQ